MNPYEYAIPAESVGNFFFPAPAAVREFSTPARPQLQHALSMWGSQSSSYFNLQPDVRYFSGDQSGFISYSPQWTPWGRINVVFTNPVAAPADMPRLLKQFAEWVPGRTLFMGVDRNIADLLAQRGYSTNMMGTEFAVPLDGFDVAGKHKKQLRHASNLGERYNLEVKEQSWDEVDAAQVQAISDAWRGQKAVNTRELRLLTRPPGFSEEWGVRKFYCYQEGRLLGYVFFDPYFDNGRVIGYCANILRTWPGAKPSGLLDFIILEAVRKFQAEGIGELSLGIAPAHGTIEVPGDRASVRWIQQKLYEHGNRFYAFKALAYHKSRYRGVENPWYLCSDDISTGQLTWALLRGTRLLGF